MRNNVKRMMMMMIRMMITKQHEKLLLLAIYKDQTHTLILFTPEPRNKTNQAL